MEFRLLGPVEVRQGNRCAAVGGSRQRALLAALLVNPNSTVNIDQLATAVWEVPPQAPESNIRTFVARLRQLFRDLGEPDSRLVTDPAGYLLRVRPGELDVEEFRALAHRGDQALRHGSYAEASVHLVAALELWRGPPLGGQAVGPSLDAEITGWHDLRLMVAERHARARLEENAPESVIGDLRGLLAEYPFHEQLWVHLIRALHRSGQQAKALTTFSTVRQMLADELGIEPGPALRRAHLEVLTEVPAQSTPPSPPVISTKVNAWRQLPMDIPWFIGRADELRRLHELVTAEEPAGGSPTIVVIEGMAGVGKTSLAVHVAHQLVGDGHFDEIQLWSDLHGFDAEHPPADPGAVLDSFLRLLGVAGESIPFDLESRAALLRDRLAGRRALVLLDNAATAEQVRPLLPGTAGSVVLVTTRRDLSKLAGRQVITLDVLPPEDSVAVLSTLVDDDRVAKAHDSAARATELCGHLPLAIVLAGRRLQSRPMWTMQDLVDRLERGESRVDTLYPGTGILHTVFDLSYRALTPPLRQIFRLLGEHPGDDFTTDDVAALSGTTTPAAEDLLEALLDEHLLRQVTAGRYRFHDLMRDYARERARAETSPADRKAATHRLLSWYLHTAEAARQVVDPHRVRIIEPAPLPSECTVPVFTDQERALTWFESERTNLLAAVRWAYESGETAVAWQLPWVLLSFYYRRSHWGDWVSGYRIGLAAARAAGERRSEGIMLRGLGVAYSDLRQFTTAIDCHRQAQIALEEVGDVHGQAWNLNNLGVIHVELEQLNDAADCFRHALPMFRKTGDRQGEGFSLNNLGDTHRRLGEPAQAISYLEDALTVQRAGDRTGMRFTLSSLADIHFDAGQYDQATTRYEQALAISRTSADQRTVARTLDKLAGTLHAAGERHTARELWHEARDIFVALGDTQAHDVEARLTK